MTRGTAAMRALLALVGLILSWFGVVQVDQALAVPSTTAVRSYAYDTQHCSAHWSQTTSERGPPSYGYTDTTTAGAVDRPAG